MPRWLCVDVKFVRKTQLLTLAEMRGFAALSQMQILQRGNRLSITPVSPAEWDFLLERLGANFGAYLLLGAFAGFYGRAAWCWRRRNHGTDPDHDIHR